MKHGRNTDKGKEDRGDVGEIRHQEITEQNSGAALELWRKLP
jgi:hypothetical protein